jgi:hypothetical protein
MKRSPAAEAGRCAYEVSYNRRVYDGTRPGRLLKHQIAIKTDRWDAQVPGFLEAVIPDRK